MATGKVTAAHKKRRRRVEFFDFMNDIVAAHADTAIHVILDNLSKDNTSSDVFADSAYRSAEAEAKLKARGFRSCIHRRAHRNHSLSDAQFRANRSKEQNPRPHRACVRSAAEFGGGRMVRTIGIVGAHAKIGLQNLAYNMRRLVTLDRMATA